MYIYSTWCLQFNVKRSDFAETQSECFLCLFM